MAIETWLPTLMGYLVPVGFFVLAWGGMSRQQARRAATLGGLALALAALGYFAVGFGFHLGGAGVLSDLPGLEGLDALYGGGDENVWGLLGLRGFFLAGGGATPEANGLFVSYLPMAATAVLLVLMGLAGRVRGWQLALGGLAVAALLFPLAACWAWGGGWLAGLGVTAQRGHGFVDHAGSGVVFLLGGRVALGGLLGVGRRAPRIRLGPPGEGQETWERTAADEMPPSHFPLVANLGALLFGLGLLGWSAGRPFHVAGAVVSAARAAANVLLAGSGAVLAAQVYSWLAIGRADPLMSARGAAAGFIALAAGAPFLPAWAALLVGLLAGLLLPLCLFVAERALRLPGGASVVVLGVVIGLLGLLAVPLFADGLQGQGWNGVPGDYRGEVDQGVTGFIPASTFGNGDGPGQLIAQLAGIGAIGLLAFGGGWLVFWLLNLPYRPGGGRR